MAHHGFASLAASIPTKNPPKPTAATSASPTPVARPKTTGMAAPVEEIGATTVMLPTARPR